MRACLSELREPGGRQGMLKASVVVIAKNEEKTIARCIESLLQQTYPCEIIVVNGHSTDRTREIVSQYPVKLVEAPPRDTYGVSRNVGVQHASGDVILFQDADDFVDPTWCESLIKHFRTHPKVGIVIARRVTPAIYRSNSWFAKLYRKRRIFNTPSQNTVREGYWHEVTTKGSAFLKRAILEAGGFDEDMFFGTEDKELAYRISRRGYKILYDPTVTVYCKPFSGVKEYLKDKFYRAGMSHGHVRRKHGVYRPPLRGVGGLGLILLGAFSWRWNPALAFILLLSSLAILWELIAEPLGFDIKLRKIPLIPPYLLTRFLGSILEFIGFLTTYLIPARYLRRVRDAL